MYDIDLSQHNMQNARADVKYDNSTWENTQSIRKGT